MDESEKMIENGPVSAYAVYRNMVHVGGKQLNTLKKSRKKNRKRNSSAKVSTKVSMKKKQIPSKNEQRTNSVCDDVQFLKEVKLSSSSQKIENHPVLSSESLSKSKPKGPGLSNRSIAIKKTKKTNKLNSKLKDKKLPKKIKLQASNVSLINRRKKSKDNNDTAARKMEDSGSGNSFLDANKAFSWLIDPLTQDVFFETAWEKRPLHIRRLQNKYFKDLLSTDQIDNMLRQHNIQYTKNLDITSYVDGKRETHNPVGRAYPSVVWDYYKNGCSIRLLNPQTYIDKIWKLCATLQDLFGCFVGANVYLTPPDSQGFAPHYDDIEAFILQLEGKKRWRLYIPQNENEFLPRYSSDNLSQEEIGDPVLDVVLEPGDLLYFPRGVIHQGTTCPETHSLHITLSAYQKNTWGDLLEKVLPAALKVAIEEDVEFRHGLPTDYLRYMGIAHSDYTSEGRTNFIDKVGELVKRLLTYAPVDAAVDQMGKQLMHDALPPILSSAEKSRTVLEDGERMSNGKVTNRVEFHPDVRIKLLRGNILRLVIEEDSVRAYHCIENSREYHALEEPQFIELSPELAPGVEFLIHSYPSFVSIEEMPINDELQKLQLVGDLWEKGLLMTEVPLDIVSD